MVVDQQLVGRPLGGVEPEDAQHGTDL